MPLKEHPDYKEELNHLTDTKEYMEQVISESENNRGSYEENIKQAMRGLNPTDGSESYINLLVNTRFLERAMENIHHLKRLRSKPYFARIDLKTKHLPTVEKLYIGKTSLFRSDNLQPVIIDWRAPVANVYYEGRLGEVSYEVDEEQITGELKRKRQYVIEEGGLQDFQDIDITTRDELLQASLGSNADHRLKEIVSTIQAEQNQIIRADMYRPLIVQGVAGSGKTTIALHRIAYFIYTYAEHFNPEQFLILAPNRLFLNYIADVLPELGVEQVQQKTYIDFLQELIGTKYKVGDPNLKFIEITSRPPEDPTRRLLIWESTFKGSMEYKRVIDGYIQEIEEGLHPSDDFKLGKRVIYSKEEVKRMIVKDYSYLPLFGRIEKIKKVLTQTIKEKRKEFIIETENKYDKLLQQNNWTIREEEKRHKRALQIIEKKERIVEFIEKQSKTLVKEYMKQFSKKDLFTYYFDLLVDKEKLLTLLNRKELEQEVEFLSTQSVTRLKKKIYELEDTGALLYLQTQLFGFKEPIKIRNVVIDEAQDFSLFQLFALKKAINTDLFSILGDLSQGIHSYRGIQNWDQVLEHIYPNGAFKTLEQSYRTTVEIMNLANEIIRQSQVPNLILAKPVVRHGEKPALIQYQNDFVPDLEQKIKEMKEQGFKSIAIISKTIEECQKIDDLINKKSDMKVRLFLGDEEYQTDEVILVPAHIAKGLEFDVVMIVSVDEEFIQEDLDIKLLYVAMTRPLHRLFVYYREKTYSLLKQVDPATYLIEEIDG